MERRKRGRKDEREKIDKGKWEEKNKEKEKRKK